MNNINENSWYFNISKQLEGTHLDLIYKRTKAPLDEGFINSIESPCDILITEETKRMVLREILEVLSETNNKNKLSIYNSSLEFAVDLPSFLTDSLKDIKFLQNLEVSGFFNPFDLSMLSMYKGEKGFFSDSSNTVFVELLCPYGFEGGSYKIPTNVDKLNVKSSDACSYAGRRVNFERSTTDFKSTCVIESNGFNSGLFRNLKELTASCNFNSIRCFNLNSVSLGKSLDVELIPLRFNSLNLVSENQNQQDYIDLNQVNEIILGSDVSPEYLRVNTGYITGTTFFNLIASKEFISKFPFLNNTSDDIQ